MGNSLQRPSQRAAALATVREMGGSILMAKSHDGRFEPVPHRAIHALDHSIWSTGASNPNEVAKHIPEHYRGALFHVRQDGSRSSGIPVVRIKITSESEWEHFPYVKEYSTHAKAPARQIEPVAKVAPAPNLSDLAAQRARSQAEVRRLRLAETRARRNLERAKADIDKFDDLKQHESELRGARKRAQAAAYANEQSDCDTSRIDREIEAAAKSVGEAGENAEVASAALPDLEKQLAGCSKALENAESGLKGATARWAKLVRSSR